MGFLGKLFGGKGGDASGLMPTAEMLGEDQFWAIVAKSLQDADDQDAQEQSLLQQLGQLSPADMIGFRLRTDKLLYDSYNAAFWCAGYIMNGGCSDDGFEYFRNWVISRGRDVYYKAMENPDTLASQIDEDIESYEFESFWYVALEAFEKKTGKDLYEFIDDTNHPYSEFNYPPIEFTWKEDDPASMQAICPTLFERMWKSQ